MGIAEKNEMYRRERNRSVSVVCEKTGRRCLTSKHEETVKADTES